MKCPGDYQKAVEYIEELPRFTKKHSLDHTREFLRLLGDPGLDRKIIHVAGTNGKGSVCAYVASVLQAAGYKVGLFTSPFILCFEERIRVNGENITGEELARAVAAVRPAAMSSNSVG